MDLRMVPDKDLKAEVERRRVAELAHMEEIRRHRQKLIVRGIETLLSIHPDHERTSCDDDNPRNSGTRAGRVRCTRCCLLDIKRNPDLVSAYDVSIHISYLEG